VREIVRGEESALAAAMTRGTASDDCIVCVFWTCTCTVEGVAMLLLPIVPDKVLPSTAVVASAAPFQRMAACVGKFVPVTFRVMVCEPAVMVFGRTAVMLGVAAVCWVAVCTVGPDAQPRQ
jgi:hypothetical protein